MTRPGVFRIASCSSAVDPAMVVLRSILEAGSPQVEFVLLSDPSKKGSFALGSRLTAGHLDRLCRAQHFDRVNSSTGLPRDLNALDEFYSFLAVSNTQCQSAMTGMSSGAASVVGFGELVTDVNSPGILVRSALDDDDDSQLCE